MTLQDVLSARAALEHPRRFHRGQRPGRCRHSDQSVRVASPATRKLTTSLNSSAAATCQRRDKGESLNKLWGFFAGLPVENKPRTFTLSVDKKKLDASDSVSKPFSYMPVSQGGKQVLDFSLIAAKDENCTLEYSGGDASIGTRKPPAAPCPAR